MSPASSILFIPPLNGFQDLSKVIYAMQHITASDARRHFIFGITIENTSLGLWYANRPMLACSGLLDTTKVVIPFLLVF